MPARARSGASWPPGGSAPHPVKSAALPYVRPRRSGGAGCRFGPTAVSVQGICRRDWLRGHHFWAGVLLQVQRCSFTPSSGRLLGMSMHSPEFGLRQEPSE
jgi:hypothetical protein